MLSKWLDAHAASKRFVTIFASNDKSEAEAQKYYAEMSLPFAIPFGDASISKIGTAFKVEGIPTLLIFDAAGNLVAKDVRRKLTEDKTGAGFPYRPPTLESVLTACPTVVNGAGVESPMADVMTRKYLALQFSAHWCGPCRAFTPSFAAWYSEQKAANADIEVLFVSSDRDDASFRTYAAEMPWKSLPFAERAAKEALSELYAVKGIPTVILLAKDANGVYQVECADMRSKLDADPTGFPWPPTAVERIDDAVEKINELPYLVAFTDKLTSEGAETAVIAAVEAAAAKYFVDGRPSDALRFATASDKDDATEQVRQFAGGSRDKDGPFSVRVVIVDVQGQGKVDLALPAGTLPTAEGLAAFAADFVAGKLELSRFR